MDPTSNDAPNDDTPTGATDDRVYRSEPYVQTSEIPMLDMDQLKAAAGMTAPGKNLGPSTDSDSDSDSGFTAGAGNADDPVPGEPRTSFRRRHPKLAIAAIVVAVLMIPVTITYVQALRKEGNESFTARTAEWARDMKLGFVVDWAEQRHYATDQFEQGGTPGAGVFKPAETTAAPSSGPTNSAQATSTKPTVDHLTPPARLASPISPAAAGEGEWTPVGPLISGLPGVYTTRVRPNVEHGSLAVFVSWSDPKLTDIKLYPGTDLPGGTWDLPHFLTPEICPKVIMASNGGFRMDQSRGGYYAEGREPFKLKDGAASMVFFKDGHVDVGEWGRDFKRGDLDKMASVRQNLELIVDDGQPVANIEKDKDWGALLPNSYFVWRSGYGVTKDGALVYAGGPALKPADLARTLINAGAVRVMEGDINPEWVTANLYGVGPDGKCFGTKGLDQSEDKGGMRQIANRYLTTDTRDFVVVSAKP